MRSLFLGFLLSGCLFGQAGGVQCLGGTQPTVTSYIFIGCPTTINTPYHETVADRPGSTGVKKVSVVGTEVTDSNAPLTTTDLPVALSSQISINGLNITASTGTLAIPNGVSFAPPLTGTTGSIGGGLLAAGACASGTATVAGATTSMAATLPQPAAYPGDGFEFYAYISSSNTVTVKVCAIVALTPTATTYTVKVVQ